MTKLNLIELLNNYHPSDLKEKKYKNEMIEFLKKNDVFLGKENKKGHITASSIIVSKNRNEVLFTYHKKLNKWLQLGGHTEINEHILESALREAKEESGLKNIKIINEKIFDIDIHKIPKYHNEEEHFHYDIRFLFEADRKDLIKISNESKDLKWIKIDEIRKYTNSESIIRPIEKIKGGKND